MEIKMECNILKWKVVCQFNSGRVCNYSLMQRFLFLKGLPYEKVLFIKFLLFFFIQSRLQEKDSYCIEMFIFSIIYSILWFYILRRESCCNEVGYSQFNICYSCFQQIQEVVIFGEFYLLSSFSIQLPNLMFKVSCPCQKACAFHL